MSDADSLQDFADIIFVLIIICFVLTAMVFYYKGKSDRKDDNE